MRITNSIAIQLMKRYILCEQCKNKAFEDIHHIDGDPSNNELSNLMLLCTKCHMISRNESVSGMTSISNGKSTAIPISVRKQWKLELGDKLDWTWDKVGGKMIIILTKIDDDSTLSEKEFNREIKKAARRLRSK